jgi:hypothetical protein
MRSGCGLNFFNCPAVEIHHTLPALGRVESSAWRHGKRKTKKKAGIVSDTGLLTGVPTGIRTPVLTVKG